MSMNNSFDVLIVGGGVVGLTAALAMASLGYRSAVLDAGALMVDCTHIDSRVYAINSASESLLKKLGVWSRLDAQRISPYQKMHVWEAAHGAAIDFDARCIASDHLGTIIEESIIKKALLEQIAVQPKVTLFAQTKVIDIQENTDGITLFDANACWYGALLIVADGAHSPTRNKLKVPVSHWSYQQHALVTTVHTEYPHQKTAYQVFHPEGPLAFLPLADAHLCSIVWSTTPERAAQLLALDDDSFSSTLTQAFVNKLGCVSVQSARFNFPLHMRHVQQYSGSRWILMGDAAHTIHPLAGLGLNVGLADVACWLRLMSGVRASLNSRTLLGQYQRERKSAVWQTIALMESIKRLFASSLLPVSLLRSLGLQMCNQLTVLKRYFIEQASG